MCKSGFLVVYGNQDNAQYNEDAAIILGASVCNEQVSPSLAKRLDQGEEYQKKNPRAVLIVTGGKGVQECISEALALYSMSSTMEANLLIGTAKLSSVLATNGRADMSNMPSTALGRSAAFSRRVFIGVSKPHSINL